MNSLQIVLIGYYLNVERTFSEPGVSINIKIAPLVIVAYAVICGSYVIHLKRRRESKDESPE